MFTYSEDTVLDGDDGSELEQRDTAIIPTLNSTPTTSPFLRTVGAHNRKFSRLNPDTAASTTLPLQSCEVPLSDLEHAPKLKNRAPTTKAEMIRKLEKFSWKHGNASERDSASIELVRDKSQRSNSYRVIPSLARMPSPSKMATEDMSPRASIRCTVIGNTKKRSAESSLCGKTKRNGEILPIVIEIIDDDPKEQIISRTASSDAQNSRFPAGRKPTADELNQTVIEILDEEEETIEVSTVERHVTKSKVPKKLSIDFLVIDLDEHEDFLYREELKMEEELRLAANRGMEANRRSTSGCRGSTTLMPLRNLPVTLPWVLIQSIDANNFVVKPGMSIELPDNTFLRVVMVLRNTVNNEIKLRGHRIQRTRDLNGILYRKLNELCWVIDIDLDDHRPDLEQAMEEVPLENIIKIREVRTTNQLFPKGSFRDAGGYSDSSEVQLIGPCTVRWRYTCKYLCATDRFHNKWAERCLEHLRQNDVSGQRWNSLNLTDEAVRLQYRGYTSPGGGYGASKCNQSTTGKSKGKSVEKKLSSLTILSYDGISVSDTVKFSSRMPLSPRKRSLRTTVEVLNDSFKPIDLTEEDSCGDTGAKSNGRRQRTSRFNTPDESVFQTRPSRTSDIIFIDKPIESVAPSEGHMNSSVSAATASAPKFRKPGQAYTYGDGFSGAGGTTRGAVMAGLKPIWGFDGDGHACKSWRLNFPDASLYEMMADQFIQRGLETSDLKVDVLHLSPPCQYFSPAHTVAGMNDEMNSASLFACGYILDIARPRIVTLEQTFGILLLPRFQAYFNSLILMFTDRGFSLRWKIAQLQNWGLPQRRQRLIIFASCPGETLPEFPPFTHCNPKSPVNGLKPWSSVNRVLASIPRGTANHDLENVKALNNVPWSGESIAPRCITTHGGHNYHPSGKRGLTNREFAALQGFPNDHLFSDVNVKKQIGNAVPPSIAKVLFESIKKSLEKADGIISDHYEID